MQSDAKTELKKEIQEFYELIPSVWMNEESLNTDLEKENSYFGNDPCRMSLIYDLSVKLTKILNMISDTI